MARDMLLRKFESCARMQRFDPIPREGVFVSGDGLSVRPVLIREADGHLRIDRRATLQLMIEARRTTAAKRETTGALTPMASVDPPQLGE